MITFAIDTSSQSSSLAIFNDEMVLASVKHQSHKLQTGFFKVVDETLKEMRLSPKDINRVVVGIGPGSFTGVRIGVAFAKTFCQLTEADIYSIRSYFLCLNGFKTGVHYIPVIPSTRNECYASLFMINNKENAEVIRDIDDGGPVRIAQWISKLGSDTEVYIFGEGANMLSNVDLPSGRKIYIQNPEETLPHAEYAFTLLKDFPGMFEITNALTLKPLYVRPSPAELKKIDSGKGEK